MRHVPTMAELTEDMGFRHYYSAEDYNIARILAEITEQLKSKSDCDDIASRLSRGQLDRAMGIVIALLATHELAQAEREGASR